MSLSGGQAFPDGRISGVMVAVVSNNEDPEDLGRVKLKLPIYEGKSETDWVRIATFFGGKERGGYFIPEVGDEVLVAFHLGDPARPFVIGMLWNKKNPPPGKDVNIRKFTSKSGHEIAFDDGDSGKVMVKTKGGQVMEMDKDKIKLAGIGNTTLTMEKDVLTLKSGSATIKLESSGKITISANAGIKLESSSKVNVAGGMVEIKSNGMLDINASGITNIKGSMVKIN